MLTQLNVSNIKLRQSNVLFRIALVKAAFSFYLPLDITSRAYLKNPHTELT